MPSRKSTVVTVTDIAREAGVSASSVSAVLSGQHVKRRVSAETVARILETARRLKYVPNVTARSLRARDSGTKHVVLSVLTSYEAPPFLVSQAVYALEAAITKRGEDPSHYTVTVEMFHSGRLQQLCAQGESHRYNGAIIANTIDLDDQFLASTRLPFPVVLLGRRLAGYPSVAAKSEVTGRKAAEILTEAGRRRLAVLQPAVLTQATRSRLSAFVVASEQLTGQPPMMITCDNLAEISGYRAMKRFLDYNPACDGVFAISDGLAIGAYHAIKTSGRAIPGDIAVVGVGDNPASRFLDPALTCFDYPETTQNQMAAELLLDLVNGTPPASQVFEVSVAPILRESTGHISKPIPA